MDFDDWQDYEYEYTEKKRITWYTVFYIFLATILVVEVVAIVVSASNSRPSKAVEDKNNQVEEITSELLYDSQLSMSFPSHYCQNDARWKNLSYSSGTVETYGCGLTCVAWYISYITQDFEYGVDDLLNEVGNSCLDDDVNDMGKFCEYLESEYNIVATEQIWEVEEAKQLLENGYMLFASMDGQLMLGYRNYQGHIVLVYLKQDGNIYVMDPGDSSFNVPISEQRFDEVFTGEYFYGVTTNIDS